MAITQIIATLPAVLNDSATFYEDIAERNNSLVTTVLPSINAWALQANLTQTEINAKALQVAAQAVDGGYSQTYINTNFVGVNNAQTIAGIKTFSSSPIVPTPTTGTQAANKNYADLKVALASFIGTNQNLAAAGYQKLPGGLIVQWGVAPDSDNTLVTGSFPIAFPNSTSIIVGSQRGVAIVPQATSFNIISLAQYQYRSAGGSGGVGASYIAIGY